MFHGTCGRFKDLLSDLFSKMDATGTGKITISEFEKLFEDEERGFGFEDHRDGMPGILSVEADAKLFRDSLSDFRGDAARA